MFREVFLEKENSSLKVRKRVMERREWWEWMGRFGGPASAYLGNSLVFGDSRVGASSVDGGNVI